VELCPYTLEDALLDEAEQFGFDVVAGELDRELLGALTIARLREDLINGLPDGLRGGLVGSHVDARAGPLDVSRDLFLIFGKTGGDDRNSVGDRHVDGTVASNRAGSPNP
jgi:hypothetical protein